MRTALPNLDESAFPGAWVVRRAARLVLGALGAVVVLAGVALVAVRAPVTVKAPGVVEPARVLGIRARATGLVAAVHVRTGDSVRVGQEVAQLDTTDLGAAVAKAGARLATLRLEAERAMASEPLDSADAAAAQERARAALVRARAMFRERAADFGRGANPDSLLAAYVPGRHTALDVAYAEILAAQAGVTEAGGRMARHGLAPLARSLEREAIREVMDELAALRGALAMRVIRAPSAGMVLTDDPELLVGRGVVAGESILDLGDMNAWIVAARVGERDVQRLRVGDSANVEIPAIARERRTAIRGRVASIGAQPRAAGMAAPTATEYRVVITIGAQGARGVAANSLRRGYTADVHIVTEAGPLWSLLLHRLTGGRR